MILHTAKWQTLLFRGICGVLFGILAFIWPTITLFALVILYGWYAIFDGIAALGFGVSGKKEHQSWAMVVVGLLGIFSGIFALFLPGISALALLIVIAFWAVLRGIFEIAAAIHLRKEIENEWLLVLAGVCSIIFGALLFAQPSIGLITLVWLIGTYAFVFGIITISLSVKVRRHMIEHDGHGQLHHVARV